MERLSKIYWIFWAIPMIAILLRWEIALYLILLPLSLGVIMLIWLEMGIKKLNREIAEIDAKMLELIKDENLLL